MHSAMMEAFATELFPPFPRADVVDSFVRGSIRLPRGLGLWRHVGASSSLESNILGN